MKRSTVLACIAAAIFVGVAAAADERYFGLEAPRQRPEVFEPAVIAAILPQGHLRFVGVGALVAPAAPTSTLHARATAASGRGRRVYRR